MVCALPAAARPALEPVSFEQFEQLFPLDETVWKRKSDVLLGIENSLDYLRSKRAEAAYKHFADSGIDQMRVIQSLLRFRTLLFRARSPRQLMDELRKEFVVIRSKGADGEGGVKFTGYFQPVYKASLKRDSLYRYPIYSIPENFSSWPKPHPTRVSLEGYEGRGRPGGPLEGRELAFLSNRYEAYMIHVQGSAILELTDGRHLGVGFAGATAHPFQGVPKSFLSQRKLRWGEIGRHFRENPSDLNAILSHNNRFIFFRANPNHDPIGSLGVPVVAQRSIATDKSMMPPGALALINADLPLRNMHGEINVARRPQFVFDQDAGSAIKGPGRVDLFMGTGADAGQMANHVSSRGTLYYLLLK